MRSFSLLMLLLACNFIVAVHSLQCLQHEQSSLLQLKNKMVFLFYSTPSDQLVTWNSSTDCCVWQGVTCNASSGHVIGLDLNNHMISGGIDNTSSPLFDLHHLRRLDLSRNYFNGTPIPPGIAKLANLLHLDLSYSDFGGQVPVEISSLTTLLTLDLSGNLNLKTKLSGLVHNLTRLTELKLDFVDLSAEADQWCHALSSSLPNLQVLSLSLCSLPAGSLDISLVKLQALSVIDLSHNNLLAAMPTFLSRFTNLTSLGLGNCSLYGNFPEKIAATIQTIDLSANRLLSGTLPETIGDLKMLRELDLHDCGLRGSIANIRWENLLDLADLDLSGNALIGSIPSALFSLPSLKLLDLSWNQFSGEFPIVSSSNSILNCLIFGRNNLEGTIPMSISKLEGLWELGISHNNFSGSIDLTYLLQNLVNLSYIDLSANSLSVVDSVASASTIYSSFPNLLEGVNLASCNLKAFPDFLRNQSWLQLLDLSDNQMHGLIPDWILTPNLLEFNLSRNFLTGFQGTFPNLTSLLNLDLSSNLLRGDIPLPPYATYLDYSNNDFTSLIPPNIGNYVSIIEFLSLKSNNFHGSIPLSICYFSNDNIDVIIDFSYNSLSGIIPPCLISMNFGVLNLRGNNLSGNIPNTFQPTCLLQTLDLNDNQLQGNVPKSMVHCKRLQFVNLGNNQIHGGFPCWLMEISALRVLVLRSNRFYGPVSCALGNATTTTNSWSMLQFIDIAANNFGGELPYGSFKSRKAMISPTIRDTVRPKFDDNRTRSHYQDKLTVYNKGLVMEMVKILTIFSLVDFSYNHFHGSIPESIGDLKSLHALNLSHNHFRGQIPSYLGHLREMESLDLANNSLSGDIPVELANLNFLSFLNLSYNHLEGRIPTSTQLQSFSEMSYTGNKGLYGSPLVTNTSIGGPIDPTSSKVDSKEIDWEVICAEIGYAAGLGTVVASLVLWERWRLWYFARVDQILFKIFPQLEQRSINHRRRRRMQRRTGRQRQ